MPKADPFTQRRLLELAALDQSISAARHRAKSMPELAEIEGGERRLADLATARVEAETDLADLDRDSTRLDAEIDQVRARAARDAQLLAAGGAPAKELENLQHELDSLARRQGVLEDEALELMERREEAASVATAAVTAETTGATALADARLRRDAVLAEVDAAVAELTQRRQEVSVPVPADVLAVYEKLRAAGKVAAGELVGGTCGACKLTLDRVELAALRSAPLDEVVRCPECGALLVRA